MTKTLTTPTLYVAPVRVDTDHLPLLDVDTLPSSTFWRILGHAVTLRRDYGSATEAAFTAWLSRQLPTTMIDAAGNIHVDTRTTSEHRSMFTAHTDTVHSSGGINKVRVDGDIWRADKGSALGADDGSGCAVLSHMIEAGVPGYYVFFRGEERGGIGSKWLSRHMPELFADIDRAVAFDRAGYYDVITHQSGGRCCSDEFAQALSDQLSSEANWFMPCDGGVYTDTAEFTRLIPECTNVSVGYDHQHGDREEQDTVFLWSLAQRCVAVQWDSLPTARDPRPVKLDKEPSMKGVYYGYDDYMYDNDDDDNEDLLDIIADVRTGSRPTELVYMIAEAAWPENPDMAVKNINPRYLDAEALDYAEGMLEQGWTAEETLLELYEVCTL